MSVSVPTWPKIQASVDPRTYMRNGVAPSGPQVASFTVGLLNHCLGHRMRRHFAKTIAASELVNNGGGAGSITTWRFMMRTMPNETTTRARFVFGPSDSDTPEPTGKVWLTITRDSDSSVIYDDGTSGTDKSLTYATAIASPTAAVLNDLTESTQDYTLVGDTLYRVDLHTEASASVHALTVYGVPRAILDTTADVVVDPAKFLVNQPITQTQNADVLDSLATLWKRHGSAMAYSIPGTTPKTVASATSTNILDSTTTWTSSTKGFLYPSLNKHSHDTTLGTPTYAAPVQAWCYAGCSGGGTATVRFRYGTGGSDYIEVGSITSNGWYKATGTIPGNADQKVDIYLSASAGTGAVYAAGLFDYEA